MSDKKIESLFHSARKSADRGADQLGAPEQKARILNNVMASIIDDAPTSTVPADRLGLIDRVREAIHFNIPTTIMTITGLTAAAIVAASFLSAPSSSHIPTTAHRSSPTNRTDRATKRPFAETNIQPSLPAMQGASSLRAQFLPVSTKPTTTASVDSLLKKVDLGGIKPIEPTNAELQKLAIIFDDNGDVVYYFHDAQQNGKTTRHIFPQRAGMKFLSTAISNADTAGVSIPDFYPRMVTNADGQKRFFHFEESNFIHNSTKDGTLDSSNRSSLVVSQVIDGDDEGNEVPRTPPTPPRMILTDQQVVTATDNNGDIGDNHGEAHNIIETLTDTTDAHGDHLITKKRMLVNGTANTAMKRRVDSIMKSMGITPQKGQKMVIRMNVNTSANASSMMHDSAFSRNHGASLGERFDSSMASFKQLNLDSIGTMIKIMNIDSMAYSSLRGLDSVGVTLKRMNLDSLGTMFRHMNLDSLIHRSFEEIKLHQPDINKLIPVVVKNRNHGHRNDLILWYDATPKVLAQLPKDGIINAPASATVNGALSSLSVFPNPTATSTTVRYHLGESRSVVFAVYSLLGQKMLDGDDAARGGSIGAQAAGEAELKLDVSKLNAGVYLLIAKTDHGEQLTQRLVIEK
jgi:hypothetical protein